MADGDFNLATLWVSVVPEVSQVGQKIEDAGEDAKKRWTDKVKDFGKTITDDLERAGEKTREILGKAGSDGSKSFADNFKSIGGGGWGDIAKEVGDSLGSGLGKQLGDAFKESGVGQAVTGVFDNISKSADHVRSGIQDVHDVIAGLQGGDVGSALTGISSAFDHIGTLTGVVGVDISGLKGPLGDVLGTAEGVVGQFDSMKGGIQEFAGLTESLAPGISAALSEALGPIAIAATGISLIINGLPGIGGGLNQILAAPDPTKGFQSPIQGPPLEQTPASKMPLPGQSQPVAPPPGAPPGVQYRASQGSLDPFAGLLPPGVTPPDLSSPGSISPPDTGGISTPSSPFTVPPHQPPPPPRFQPTPPAAPPPIPVPTSIVPSGSVTGAIGGPADLHAAGGRVGALYALAGAMEGTPYSQALRNDCSGMVSELAAAAVGLPPPSPGERFSTPNEGSWLASHGFQSGRGGPGDLRIGWNPAPGNEGHTAATLPGGEHAESGGSHGDFRVGRGAVGADDPYFSQHAYLPMGAGGGALGTPISQSGGGQAPIGTEHDPVYVTIPSGGGSGGGGAGGGSSSAENQAQQLGQGLLGGLAQSVGLDGSVFGGKSPMDWGSVKMGMGVLNWGLGIAKQRAGMMGGEGAAVSAGAVPGGAGGSLSIGGAAGGAAGASNQNINYDNSINVSGNNFHPQNPMLQDLQHQQNSRSAAALSGLPAPSVGAP